MIGTTLGPYRIDRELGSGGMGRVYAATVTGRCPGLAAGTRVALKVVHPHLLDTPGFFKRFLREAEIGRAVVHENVVRTFDCDAVRENHYLVMEYVEGQTLRGLAKELDRVPEELCRHIGREVAKGLAAIHATGVVHRDLKPENVLITADHVVKVMDLGVARLSDEALRLSQTGAFVGSIHYAAPECFSEGGRHVDGRADLHALGLVLYELSCGVNPYLADEVPQILRKVLHEAPRRLGDVHPQLSPFFEEVVHTLLAKEPRERFADAATLLSVLEEGEKSAWWSSRARAIRAVTHQPLRRIRIPRETAVYGREDDLARLRAIFGKAKTGDGQVVVIEGEAGIGKSRVVDELIGRLQRDGEDLNFLFGSYPPGGAATATGAFSTAFREQFGDTDLADTLRERLGVAGMLAPAFAALLQGTAPPAGAEPLTKDSLQTCFVATLRSLAADRTTVLLIDDLHFATEDARSLFTSVALSIPGHRIVLVGTTRPGIDEKWLAGLTRLPQTTQMALHRLGPKDLAALLKDSLRSETLALSLAGQIGEKSDGNPFFVFEIIRGLRDGQFLTQRDDGTWVSTRVIDDIRIPSSILDLVNARVADLTPEERDLLDMAACWGFEFDPAVIAAAIGVGPVPALKQCAQIERRHRLVRSFGRHYAFDHHQVQEALYGALNEQLREHYHAALAEAVETRASATDKDPAALDGALCVDLCEHFLKGARGDRALRYLTAAHEHLTKGYLNEAATRLGERALAAPGLLVGAERARGLLRLCGMYGPLDRLGRRGRQEEAAREAERLAEASGDGALHGAASTSLGWLLLHTGRPGEAEAAFRSALEMAKARGDRNAEVAATGNLGLVFESQGRMAEAATHFERCLTISREIGHRAGEAAATGNLGMVCHSQGRFAEAREHFERHLALAREIGDRQGEAASTANLGLVFHEQRRFAEAKEHFERVLATARATGHRRGEALVTGNLGMTFSSQGRLADAREHYERQLAIAREIGAPRQEAIALVNLGPLWLRLGETGRAREALGASVALCREIGARYPEGFGLLGLGRVADEAGDAAGARQFVEQSVALRRDIGHGDGLADSLVRLAELLLREGDAAGARAAAEEALALSRQNGWQAKVARALCVLARLPGGDAEAAIAAVERAGRDEDSPSLRFHLWKATGDRAQLQTAKRLLDEALAAVPPAHHAAMLANVRLNREIAAEAKAAGL